MRRCDSCAIDFRYSFIASRNFCMSSAIFSGGAPSASAFSSSRFDAVELGAQIGNIAILDADRDLPQEIDGAADVVFVLGIADARRDGADRHQRARFSR